MKPDLTAYLGKEVSVVVDRPLGSTHPEDDEFLYPLNYGYLPGTVSGDGEPIDTYLLGLSMPVAEAHGTVVAVVIRADDEEDKLVVAPVGRTFTEEEIAAAVDFQERYFTSRIVV